jgi:hypothetical protein
LADVSEMPAVSIVRATAPQKSPLKRRSIPTRQHNVPEDNPLLKHWFIHKYANLRHLELFFPDLATKYYEVRGKILLDIQITNSIKFSVCVRLVKITYTSLRFIYAVEADSNEAFTVVS